MEDDVEECIRLGGIDLIARYDAETGRIVGEPA